MMNNKIPFDIKYKNQIKSGKYRVVTRYDDEKQVRIVCWNRKDKYRPILALITSSDGEEFNNYYTIHGWSNPEEKYIDKYDLFLIENKTDAQSLVEELKLHLSLLTEEERQQEWEEIKKWEEQNFNVKIENNSNENEVDRVINEISQKYNNIKDACIETFSWGKSRLIEKVVEYIKNTAHTFFNDDKACEHSKVLAEYIKEYLEK